MNMLKEYLKEKNISIYSLSKKTSIPYSTLNDLCNGRVEIENCKLSIALKLSNALNISIEELLEISQSKDKIIEIKDYNLKATIRVKNKRYYVEYGDDNNIDLFKVNKINSTCVKDAAKWLVEDSLIDKQMEEIYALLLNEKK